MRALSIRQPYAELILRGIKTAELRSMSTTIVGERFYIYACKAKAKQPIWSDDLRVGTPPAWMIELAEQDSSALNYGTQLAERSTFGS